MFIGLMGFARLYNGVHSIDQIIFGSLLGIWLAFVMHYGVREPVFSNVRFLLKESKNVTVKDYMKYSIVSAIIAILCFLVIIIPFEVVNNNFTIP